MKKPTVGSVMKVAAMVLLSATIANAGEDISFSSAVTRLYNVNETISASDEDINKSRMEQYAARGLFFPTLSVNAGYLLFSDDIDVKVDLSPLKDTLGSIPNLGPLLQGFPSSVSQTLQKDQLFTINASAIWPIFTGGKILAANKAANLKVEGAEIGKEAVKSKLTSQLATLYFGVRLANEVVALRKEAYDTIKDHYEKAVKLEKAGVLAKIERMHAEVALAEADRNYKQSLRDAELSKSALKSLLNIDTDINPNTPLFIVPDTGFEPLSYFQDQAMGSNHDIKRLDIGTKLTDTAATSSYSTFMPSVFLFGMTDIYSYQKSEMLPDWSVGVGVTYTVFEGLSGVNKVRAAKAAQRSIQLTGIRARKDIKTLVEQHYLTMANARADYESVKSSIDFTEEYLRARRKAFSQGMATSLDVVDAELALSSAKMAAVTAAYKFDIAMAKLLETSGLLGVFEDYRAKATVELGL